MAVFGVDEKVATPGQRAIALALGGVVSLLMTLSVFRTTALVEVVLRGFRKKHPGHPYALAHRALVGRSLRSISANCYMAFVPLGVTIAFFLLACLAWRQAVAP